MSGKRRKRFYGVVLATLMICGTVFSGDLTQGLISHWKLDELDGDIAWDSAGDNDGQIHGAEWTLGKLAGALYFDGTNDAVNFGRPENLKDMGSGTISLWFRPNSSIDNTLGSWLSLFNKNATGVGYPGDTLLAFCPSRWSCTGRLNFDVINDADVQFVVHSDTDFWPADTWQHVAVTWDNVTGQMRMYMNAVEQADKIENFAGLAMAVDRDVTIGSTSEMHKYFWSGKIDDVAIWNRALSAQEATQLFNSYAEKYKIYVDIKPPSCPNPLNPSSRGVLPVAILGGEDFDVNSIDIATLRLAGVAPVRCSFEDVAGPGVDTNDCDCNTIGPDGYTDMVLKFKTQEIVEQIYSELGGDLVKGDWLELLLTGQLADQTPIEGADCVVIVGKVPHSLAARKADINKDGMVDTFDFAALSEHWLQPADRD